MGDKIQKIILPLLLFLSVSALGQDGNEPSDSLVRLISAKSIQLQEFNGVTLRKAIDATFLHNGTYLISDEAVWRVEDQRIEAQGNVRLIQDETILTSDRLEYDIQQDLAMFRGTLVQLQDRDKNTLRTNFLDYNTKDSTATFYRGGSFRDKDGQIIESLNGDYDSAKKVFSFDTDVNMFTDSIFIKTEQLFYYSQTSFAEFPVDVDFWKDEYMLSARKGSYSRPDETFFFHGGVHALSEKQESWSDTLYYYRNSNNILLLSEAQLQDTTRHIAALADYIFYEDSLSRVTMNTRAALAIKTTEENKTDTLFFGADHFVYTSRRMCDISEEEKKIASSRIEEMFTDPVSEYRTKAAKEAAEAAAKAAEDDSNAPPKRPGAPAPQVPATPTPDKEKMPSADSDATSAHQDSVKTETVVPDTSRVGFLTAIGSVKGFRSDLQISCDSLRYCDLDSIARFFIDPIIWNEGNRQYSSDSIYVLIKGSRMERASLMSNAFILTREDSLLFDQIKGTEVMAYFDTTSRLRRFDALGGATALFYLKEKEALATVNKVETKMMSGTFVDGQIERVHYFDSPKNDAYPIVQLPKGDRLLKGFNWLPEKRPASKNDITTLSLRPSERNVFESKPRGDFERTEKYFPGYMGGVYRAIEIRDSLARLPRPVAVKDSVSRDSLRVDSLKVAAVDSLSAADSVKTAASDSLKAAADSVAAPSDSLRSAAADSIATPLTAKQLREQARAKKEAAREARAKELKAKKEARWAELDKKDAARAEARRQKALERKRARTKRLLIAKQKQDQADEAKYEKYKLKFEQRRARRDSAATGKKK